MSKIYFPARICKNRAPCGATDDSHPDKPLAFYWRVASDWLAGLDLPPPRTARHGRARAAILLDATIEARGKGRAISYSRRNTFYKGLQRYQGTDYSFSTVPPAVDELAGLGLLDNQVAPAGTRLGLQSTFRATAGPVNAAPLPPVEFHPPELVLLKDGERHLMAYRDTRFTDRLHRDLAAVNEALEGVDIVLGKPPDGMTVDGPFLHFPAREGKAVGAVVNTVKNTAYRVFNGAWNRGGRYYGLWVQSIPKEYRPSLIVNGQATIEADYRELHPNLLYALEGKRLDGGAYDVDGWPRDLAKTAFNTIINAASASAALRAVALDIGGTGAFQRAKELIGAIEARHPKIAHHFNSGIGLELQYRDSVMACQVQRLLRKQGVAAVPVHDSFIVPEPSKGVLIEAMEEALNTATNGLVSMDRDRRHFPLSFIALRQKSSTSGPPAPWTVPGGIGEFQGERGLSTNRAPAKIRSLDGTAFAHFKAVQGDLFGGDVATVSADTLEAWRGGKAPASICRAVEVKRKLDGLTQEVLAGRIGVSRPQLVNVLQGRFGLSPAPTAQLKAYLVAA